MIKNLLPSNSRVWVYQSVRQLNPEEAREVDQRIRQFVSNWTSHKEGVVGDGTLLYDRFVVLMADEEHTGVSGCSLDSSIHFVKAIEKEFETNFFDRWNIAYKKDGQVLSCNLNEFGRLLEEGEINDDTIVFNNLVQSKKDFESKWQIPYKESWLKNIEVTHTSFGSML
jgi:DNA phosphorothioation-dependent restriction protein DptG